MHKTKQGKGIKKLTPQQMLQRLPIALAQVKAGNSSENLLTLICINWVPGDPRSIFLVTSFTRKMSESSDSMYSSTFMLENI